MAKRRTQSKKSETAETNEARPDELGDDPGQVGSDSAGQSGDTQGLSRVADANEEDVEELTDTDQAYEAEIVDGVEDAGDHPEQPVRSHEDRNWRDPSEREDEE